MRSILGFAGFCLMLLCSQAALAQERFYFKNGSAFPYRLVEADDKIVKFAELKGESEVKRVHDRESIVVAFNAAGVFMVVKNIPRDLGQSRKSLEKFYKMQGPGTDILIKAAPLEVIPATIRMEGDAINYLTADNKPASIAKSDLVAIIYKDGRHELLRDIEEAEGLLTAATDRMLDLVSRPVSKRAEQQDSKVKAAKEVSKVDSKPVLSEEKYKEYRKKSLEKVEQFSNYLQVIVSQKFSARDRDIAIENALSLFLPDTKIEVSSKHRSGVTKLPLETYLKRLKMLPYGNVEIKWSQIEFLSELKQESDGNYYGTIVGNQTFTGYGQAGQNVMYSDITKKSVRVKLESYNKEVDGQSQADWTVLLGNIGVVSDQ